jgi:hypothetical protein
MPCAWADLLDEGGRHAGVGPIGFLPFVLKDYSRLTCSLFREHYPNVAPQRGSIMLLDRTVVLSEDAYVRIQKFAGVVGIPLERAVSNAVSEWMNGTGYLVMDAIEKRARANAARPKFILVKGARVA